MSQSSTSANIQIGGLRRAKEVITTEHSEWDDKAKVWKPTHRTEKTREYDVPEPQECVVYQPYYVNPPPAAPQPLPHNPPWGPVYAGVREADTPSSYVAGM